MRQVSDDLLSTLHIHPVLVDVGASGSTPEIWEPIARHSVYVGFDPDRRDIQEIPAGHFYKAWIVNRAVTSDPAHAEERFYLTKSPYCSSTLKPDADSLANYIFADLFTVEKETTVGATTLDAVVQRLALRSIDWFKTDSQGIDLRLFESLSDALRARVLVVDLEPGLVDAYLGEDLFAEVHNSLIRQGFWLSHMEVQGTVRMRNSTLEQLAAGHCLSYDLISRAVKSSPAWCEVRYMRTLKWLARGDFSKRDYVLAWVLACLDMQLGFALDLGLEYEQRFGADAVSPILKKEPIARMKKSCDQLSLAHARSWPIRIFRRIIHN